MDQAKDSCVSIFPALGWTFYFLLSFCPRKNKVEALMM